MESSSLKADADGKDKQPTSMGLSPSQLFQKSLNLQPLIPPLRFCLLSSSFRDLSQQHNSNDNEDPLPRVYSSSHPLPRHLPFLARLKLKTIIALTPKDPLKQVPAIGPWAEQEGITIKWIKIGAWKDDGTAAITKEIAEETISVSLL